MQDNEEVFPSVNDQELWNEILTRAKARYQNRFSEAECRRAFELTCDSLGDLLLLRSFWRKFQTQLVWRQEYLPGQDRLW